MSSEVKVSDCCQAIMIEDGKGGWTCVRCDLPCKAVPWGDPR